MEVLLKLAIVFIFICARVYRCNFLWSDLYELNGIKCGPIVFSKTKDQFYNEVDLIKTPLAILVIVAFFLKPIEPVVVLVGLAIFIVGLVLSRQARIALDKSWADLLEAPLDQQSLVVTGPYRWCRNPIYLGLFIIWVGFLITFGGSLMKYVWFWTVLLVALWFIVKSYHQVVLSEENLLLERFGDEYRNYIKATPRYLPFGGLTNKFKTIKSIF